MNAAANSRIALIGPSKADPDYAMTIAALKADEAHWAGDYEAEAHWNAIARFELSKLEKAAN